MWIIKATQGVTRNLILKFTSLLFSSSERLVPVSFEWLSLSLACERHEGGSLHIPAEKPGVLGLWTARGWLPSLPSVFLQRSLVFRACEQCDSGYRVFTWCPWRAPGPHPHLFACCSCLHRVIKKMTFAPIILHLNLQNEASCQSTVFWQDISN